MCDVYAELMTPLLEAARTEDGCIHIIYESG